MKYDNLHCREPGAGNAYVVPAEERQEPKQSNICEVFRLNPDGSIGEHIKTMPGFPEGWDEPKYNVGPKRVKEEENVVMTRADKSEKLAEAKKLIADGASVMGAAKQIDIPQSTLVTWLDKEKKEKAEPKVSTPETEVAKEETEKQAPDPLAAELTKLKLEFTNLTLASALGDVAKLNVIEYILRL